MTDDPFAGGAATATEDDPFGKPSRSGNFPKVPQLFGKLVIIKPTKFEQVPKPPQFGGKPGETVERMTADVVVFDGDEVAEYDSMYLSQAGIVGAAKRNYKAGKPTLGTVHMYPSKLSADKFPGGREEIEANAAMLAWVRAAQDDPEIKSPYNMAWGLEPATPEESARAIAWWNNRPKPNPFA